MVEKHSDALEHAVGKVESPLLVHSPDDGVEDGYEEEQARDGRDPDREVEWTQQGQMLRNREWLVAEDPELGLSQGQGVIRHGFSLGTDGDAAHCEVGLLEKKKKNSNITG